MIRDILIAEDAWHTWWTTYWWDHPYQFAIMAALSVAFAVWTYRRKP